MTIDVEPEWIEDVSGAPLKIAADEGKGQQSGKRTHPPAYGHALRYEEPRQQKQHRACDREREDERVLADDQPVRTVHQHSEIRGGPRGREIFPLQPVKPLQHEGDGRSEGEAPQGATAKCEQYEHWH